LLGSFLHFIGHIVTCLHKYKNMTNLMHSDPLKQNASLMELGLMVPLKYRFSLRSLGHTIINFILWYRKEVDMKEDA